MTRPKAARLIKLGLACLLPLVALAPMGCGEPGEGSIKIPKNADKNAIVDPFAKERAAAPAKPTAKKGGGEPIRDSKSRPAVQ